MFGALMLAVATTALAETRTNLPSASAKNAPIKSVFNQPKKFSEGRDPFYPESTRVFQAVMAENSTHTVEVSSLKVKGFYRDASGAYVVINNHTFTVGDEGDVITTGGRIHIKCVDVLPDNVVIEFNGSLHQLPINLPK